jgi:hypothetical protein
MQEPRTVATYKTALMISIVANILVGFFILLRPESFADLLGQPRPYPDTWPRHWGWQLIAINLLYLPGFADPVRNRYQNYLGILIRLSFALFFFSRGDGFIGMGVYDGLFGLLLAFTYWRVVRAHRDRRTQPVAGQASVVGPARA